MFLSHLFDSVLFVYFQDYENFDDVSGHFMQKYRKF